MLICPLQNILHVLCWTDFSWVNLLVDCEQTHHTTLFVNETKLTRTRICLAIKIWWIFRDFSQHSWRWDVMDTCLVLCGIFHNRSTLWLRPERRWTRRISMERHWKQVKTCLITKKVPLRAWETRRATMQVHQGGALMASTWPNLSPSFSKVAFHWNSCF